MIKTVNITSCPDHKNYMTNKLELSLGLDDGNYYSNCSGCLSRNWIMEANTTPRNIFLTITHFDNNGKRTATFSHCGLCSVETLEKMKQDLVNKTPFFCYCSLCSFNTIEKQDLINSPQSITICFCAIFSIDILGKLKQDIVNYQNEERLKGYKDLDLNEKKV